MTSNWIETIVGAAVLVVAGWFLIFAYGRTEGGMTGGYELSARFNKVSGLTIGSDVRLSGIKVGAVKSQKIDPDTYQAIVTFSVTRDVTLPEDSAAAITAEGLLGGNYLALIPGGSDEMLEDGDEIAETQDAVDLMGLIGKFMYSGDDKKASGSENKPS
ncbi:outer membrane lipid asymmetry maintenance protein MlaD [Pseudokordiimonas caeni]|uniref:outer membrane lipid asymmetry maintenance protein MlaD n=1 Tax=Pseudokordiimonas caeni TaxID=2997908 RepID=UPI0028111DD7|nr:outer membrane lipid asymmetry maintenance protein MlaD [Pseudokordiimonas caeni]